MKQSLKLIANLIFIIVLIAILFSYAMFQGGFVSWFLFSSFLPILLYQLGFLLYPIHNWEISRQLSQSVVRAGQSVSISITLKRKVPFPIYYCTFEEVFSDSLNRIDHGQQKYEYLDQPNKWFVKRKIKNAVFPGFKRNVTFDYTIDQVPRGKHELSAIRVKTGDVFGFVKKTHVFQVKSMIVAGPMELPLQFHGKISNFEQGVVSSSQRLPTNTNVAAGVREYEPGDRFSWIDWKQTARKNTVMTKEFEQEKNTNILVVLDSCRYPAFNPLAYEASIDVTLALLMAIQKKDTNVELLSVGEEKGKGYLPIHRGAMTKNVMLDHLTRLDASGNRPFPLLLKEEILRIGGGHVIFIVTTNLDEPFKQTVEQLYQRIKYIAVIFIQSSAFITETEKKMVGQLRVEGIDVQILTEEQLMKRPIEVNFR